MKAMVYKTYGKPDVLKPQELDIPTPQEDEVLVKLCATSLNASDWEILRGKPFYARIFGLFKPKFPILGSDIAGRVVAVGENVTQFKPGDDVFGDTFGNFGGFGEYLCAQESQLVKKLEGVSYVEAASLPQGGSLALQGLRDKGNVKSGQKLLIIGAGGSAGSFAIQMGKILGAEVTAVDHTCKLEMMRKAGADNVIDYTHHDYTKDEVQYDLIFDVFQRRSIFHFKRILKPRGRYVAAGGFMKPILQTLLLGPLIEKFSGKKMGILGLQQNCRDMAYLQTLVADKKLFAVVDQTFPFEGIPKALQLLGDGKQRGKLVIDFEILQVAS